MLALIEMKKQTYPECINIPYFSTLDDKPSDVLHSGCFILSRELGEIRHFDSWREWYLIIARGIWCPIHAGLLLGFYPILLQ
jgi:hypothetical protein